MVDDVVGGPFHRHHASPAAVLCGARQGRAATVEGLDAAQQKTGALVVDRQLPAVDQPKPDSSEGEGWVIPTGDDDAVRSAVLGLIMTVRAPHS